MKRISYVSLILETTDGDILLMLRDSQSTSLYPTQWTLACGKIDEQETPEAAARRVLAEETGLQAELAPWKRYDREHPLFVIDQHVFVGKVRSSSAALISVQDAQLFKPCEIKQLKIGYGFKSLLCEYFMTPVDHAHVHYS